MNKRTLFWSIAFFTVILVALLSIEESRTFLFALFVRIFFFVKKNLIALIVGFFLVKGKFILAMFLKKIALLSATGLGKRYMIEKVINKNLKLHFLDHISDDIKHLVGYIKKNFKDFPIVKQLITGIAFLGSLGFVGKFMGGMLAMKVFIAKFWSFILALVLKFSTAIVYFFTDYLWGSWIAPLIEILIFSWLLEWLEKVPFFKKFLLKIYDYFLNIFEWFEDWMEKVLHLPMKKFFRFLAMKIRKKIYQFIGYKKVSLREVLQKRRSIKPNKYTLLKEMRQDKTEKQRSSYVSSRQKLLDKRAKKK